MWTNSPDTSPSDFMYQRYALHPGQEMDQGKFTLVRIIEDVRDTPHKADGKMWLYLWKFNLDELETDDAGNVLSVDMSKRSTDGNPLIQVWEKDFVLWVQCWWEPVVKWKEFDLDEKKWELELLKWVISGLIWGIVIQGEANDNENTLV